MIGKKVYILGKGKTGVVVKCIYKNKKEHYKIKGDNGVLYTVIRKAAVCL